MIRWQEATIESQEQVLHCECFIQSTITCSKLTIATLERGVKYVQS